MAVFAEKRDRSILITIDRPPLNVLDLALLHELGEVLSSCAQEMAVDVVILKGSGERAFSAGVDIKDHTRDKVPEMLDVVHGVMRKLLALPQVTVALVRGACLGGGCELASCCDFILAAKGSSFSTPETQVGCYPPLALARFPSLIGYRRAAEMILTGRTFSAEEAARIGLINQVVPAGELDGALESLIAELLGKSGAVLRVTIKGLRELSLKGFPEALRRSEEIYLRELLPTEDVEEGVQAFLAKRKPRWNHR